MLFCASTGAVQVHLRGHRGVPHLRAQLLPRQRAVQGAQAQVHEGREWKERVSTRI